MIDLFEDYENIPNDIQDILDKYSEDFEDGNYEGLSMALQEVRDRGYTFEYYVNGDAYGLRPIGVPLNELEGYEDEFSEFDSRIEKRVAEEYVDTELMERLKKEWKDKNKYAGGGGVGESCDYEDATKSNFSKCLKYSNQIIFKNQKDFDKKAGGTVFPIYNSKDKYLGDVLWGDYIKLVDEGKVIDIDAEGLVDDEYEEEVSKYFVKIIFLNEKNEYAGGGGVDWYDFDKKMALINLNQINEYALKLDNIVTEDTELEEWVKMKLTRVEQNIADIKHSLSGWEKFEEFGEGGRIFKKQLLHIAKYSKDLIAMIKLGSKLMSWQENKLAISADYIDGIYHHLDYIRKTDLDKLDEYLGIKPNQYRYANGGGIKTDFNELENTELRNVLISFWNDFFNNHIGNYLSIEKENYILSNIDNVFVIVRDEDKGNFSDVEKQNIDRFLSPYFDSNKKPLFTDFFNSYEIKDNKIIIYIKDMYTDGGGVGSYNLDDEINKLYEKSGFINTDFNWKLKLLEMLQDQSIEAYNIYQKLSKEQKEDVLQEQFEVDNDMGSYGDGYIETSKENLQILLEDAKNGKKYVNGGGVGNYSEYSNDALRDMIVNLSRYENTEDDIKIIKEELERRKSYKGSDDENYAKGGGVKFERVTSMEDAVVSFLTKSNNFNYTNVSVNHSQGVSFLFQYGTLIAKKDGNNVFISDKKYSATTSKLQNLIKSIAQTKGFKVMETEFFDDGGGLDKMKIGKYQINTETFEVSDENGDIVYTGRTLLKAKKWANDTSKYDKDVVFEDNSLEITKDALGNLHFDFDRRRNTGWAFDTDDVGVAVAIITGSSFAKEEAIRNIEINSRQLRDSDRKQIVYWLSGGNKEWRFGETYNKSFDETYDEIFDDVALQIKKLMQKEKTIGGLIDLFKKYDTDYFIDYAQNEGSWGEYIFDEDYEREKEMDEELAKYEVGEDYAKEYILDNYNYKSREEILNDLINHFEQEDIEYDEDRINDIIKETFESVDKQTLSLFRHGGGVEISKNQLENMVGKKLDGWNDDIVYYGGKKYQKCYLRPYYKVC